MMNKLMTEAVSGNKNCIRSLHSLLLAMNMSMPFRFFENQFSHLRSGNRNRSSGCLSYSELHMTE